MTLSLLADMTPPVPAFGPGSVVPGLLERIFAAASTCSEVEWDEANVILSETESRSNPGPYKSERNPMARAPRNAMGDPRLRQITFRKMDQGGLSLQALNFIQRVVAERPRNGAYVINSLEEARRMSTRLLRLLKANPATRDQVVENPAEDVELQTLTFRLRDMTIYFIGGGSIGALAGKPLSWVIVDEGDKIPRVSVGSNTHIVDEAKSRFKSMPAGDALIILFSKPNQETDIVTTEYELGTKETPRMPCPHCGEMQDWVQERLRFDHCKLPSGDHDKARVLTETYYLCIRAGTPACPDGKIHDHHRGFTTAGIQFVATNPNPEPGHRSFQLNDFCLNPVHFPDASLGRIALDLIAGFKNPGKMKAVQAARFGLPEQLQRAQLTEDHILALRSNYLRGTAPSGLICCFIYSDLQGYGPKWVKGGFKRNGELVVIDWGTFLATDDLMDEAQVVVPEIDDTKPIEPAHHRDQPDNPDHRPARFTATDRTWVPSSGGIDEGDQQKLVHGFVVRSGFFFLPTKGRGGYQTRGKSLVTPSPRNYEGHEFQAYHFNDDQFKKELYLWRIRDHAKIISGKSRVARMHVPLDVDQQFVSELMSEKLTITRDKTGWQREEWTKEGGPNDFGDATKGLLVMWHVVGAEVAAAYDAEQEVPGKKPAAPLTPAAP
jgi:phage terminase large subunit GpA-like protein